MIDIKIEIKGQKAVIQGLQDFVDDVPKAIQKGLSRVAKGVHRNAYDFLSGAKGSPGSYPVPVESHNLRKLLDWMPPGKSKTTDIGTFKTGPMESIVFDSAIYAVSVHDGLGSSSKYGPRSFVTDGLIEFDRGSQVERIFEDELNRAG